jgi:mannose-1-phosphate guanylyltransferase
MSGEAFHAIVPAGGAGTRLWPLSRASRPKFLLPLTGRGRSLLQTTVDRLRPITDGISVVTGTAHAAAVARQLPDLPESDLFIEPSPHESAAAIGLAAAVLYTRDPDCVVGSFAADHVVQDRAAFGRVVAEAVATARQGHLVTVGVTPTYPATGFGYICSAGALDVPGAPSAQLVEEFREKPDETTARAYVESGRYRWNAGMFVVRAAILLELYDTYQPELAAGLRQIARAWDGPHREQVLGEVWQHLPTIAIDYAVAEPAAAARRVAVVPGSFGWDDIGDFRSVATLLPESGAGVRVLRDVVVDRDVVVGEAADVERGGPAGGSGAGSVAAAAVVADAGSGVAGDDVVAEGTSDALVVSTSGRLVALLGVSRVVVVDTPDALLVADSSRAQDVKLVVDRLRAGHADLL